MSSRPPSGVDDPTKPKSDERPVNSGKQDSSGPTPTNEDAAQQTMNRRSSTTWPLQLVQREDSIAASSANTTMEIQSRAPESQRVYLDTYLSQANTLSQSFHESSQEALRVGWRAIESGREWICRDRGRRNPEQRPAGGNARAPQGQQAWQGTQSSMSNAPTRAGQQNQATPQLQYSAPEYRPARQEHQQMAGPQPYFWITEEPGNQYSAAPHVRSAVSQRRPVDQEQRGLPKPPSMLFTAQNQLGNQTWPVPQFQPGGFEYRPAPREHQGMPRPLTYLQTLQNQPGNQYSAAPQRRPRGQGRRSLPRPPSIMSTAQNQPGNQNGSGIPFQPSRAEYRPASREQQGRPRSQPLFSAVQTRPGNHNSVVSHSPSVIPQKRPADQEERSVQGTRPLLPRPPLGERREKSSTPNPILNRVVETASSGERKLSLERPKLGPRPVRSQPPHDPQMGLNARSSSSIVEMSSDSPRTSSHENSQERVTEVVEPVDRNNTGPERPAEKVDDTSDKPPGASENESGLPRT